MPTQMPVRQSLSIPIPERLTAMARREAVVYIANQGAFELYITKTVFVSQEEEPCSPHVALKSPQLWPYLSR